MMSELVTSMPSTTFPEGIFSGLIKTGDGVNLRYTQSGPASGPNILLIAGWAQTAAQWWKQIDHFSQNYRVTAYDHRGHGESDKPSHGYRISRLAADLNDMISELDLKDFTILSHSMGVSVTLCYWDLFPESRKRISKLVLIDQAPCMTADPLWSADYATSISATLSATQVFDIASGFRGTDPRAARSSFLRRLFTPTISDKDFGWNLEQNFKMSAENAATLLIDHASNDWRDVLPLINIPTLVLGAKITLFISDGIKWTASQIPGAKLRIFENEEAGSHFMFFENPKLFNKVVDSFL
jgi:non-heme chloroperoxidase